MILNAVEDLPHPELARVSAPVEGRTADMQRSFESDCAPSLRSGSRSEAVNLFTVFVVEGAAA
jgi:hypothetical protein